MVNGKIKGRLKVSLIIITLVVISAVTYLANASFSIKSEIQDRIIRNQISNFEIIKIFDDDIIFPTGISNKNFVEFSDLNFNNDSTMLNLKDIDEYKIKISFSVNSSLVPTVNDENCLYFGSGNFSSVAFGKNYLEFACNEENITLIDRHAGVYYLEASRKDFNEVFVEYTINNINKTLKIYMEINEGIIEKITNESQYLDAFNENDFWFSVTNTDSMEIRLKELSLLY